MWGYLTASLFIVYVEIQGQAIDWCSKELSCGNEKNTMCLYKDEKNIEDCTNIVTSTSVYTRTQMLNMHNEYRDKLAGGGVTKWPKAANMRQISYDCILEDVALRWAKQCKSAHDTCRRVPEFKDVGQNRNLAGTKGKEFPEGVKGCFKGWTEEELVHVANPDAIVDKFAGGNGKYYHLSQGQAIDWCSKELSCGNEKNTMCLYKDEKNIEDCTNIVTSTSVYTRTQMLNMHNEYRDKLAGGGVTKWPKAANMRQISYDCILEDVALRWAKQCKSAHDTCRRVPEFKDVGQNRNLAGTKGKEFPEGVKGCFKGWTEEELVHVANPDAIVDKFAGGNGKYYHLSQVVWHETFKIGCAEIHTYKKKFNTVIVFCNYGPMGNWLDSKMYSKGEPASQCPSGTTKSKKYPNLCASPDDDKTQNFSCINTTGGGTVV
ncbi:hypothetical protein GE061_013438 [Apolygus lucorum]|uniref:SCP domain-containing protein n=1 Tax=Apolygus lucorum TaxID=248454 RepID=A0A8S9XNY3_APOLU|nr:hypothetical protein GE061_013438 [Apolygus lucorum]